MPYSEGKGFGSRSTPECIHEHIVLNLSLINGETREPIKIDFFFNIDTTMLVNSQPFCLKK